MDGPSLFDMYMNNNNNVVMKFINKSYMSLLINCSILTKKIEATRFAFARSHYAWV